MKPRILFWIDPLFIQFAIAKFLDEKIDAEMFAIYDFPSPLLKKSFENQNIVPFKKSWFFWDHIKKSDNYDMSYLKSFEKKYGIRLWELALTDRNFNHYNKFYHFSKDEILDLTEKECKFFEKILNEIKPQFLIIKLTDFHRNHLLYEICKAKNIKILMLSESRVGLRCHVGTSINKIPESEFNFSTTFDTQEYLKKFDRFKQLQTSKTTKDIANQLSINAKLKEIFHWFLKSYNDEYRQIYLHYGINRFNVLLHGISSKILEKRRKKFIDNNFEQDIDFKRNFIYFPLQVQPERNVDHDASFFSNQIEMVHKIAKSIPIDFILYVKEHPNSKLRNWRPINEYKTLLRMPNVRLIHPSVNSQKIIQNASIVITIAGTSGLEAAIHNVPSIVFSDVIYAELPSVTRVNNIEELPSKIRDAIKINVNPTDLSRFIQKYDASSFEFDLNGIKSKIYGAFHGLLLCDSVSPEDLDSFFIKNETYFENLVNEYVKKLT